MTPARKQALEEARAHVGVKGQPAFLTTESVVHLTADIYEPVLHDLLAAVEAVGTATWAGWMTEAYDRAKEALRS